MPVCTEARFANGLEAFVDTLAGSPSWRDVVHYRGVSAMDVGYLDLYFRILEQVRIALDGDEMAAPRPSGRPPFRTLLRAGVDRVAGRSHDAWQALRPLMADAPDREQTALVIRAAPNPTGFPVLIQLRNEHRRHVVFASWTRGVEPHVRRLQLPYVHLGDLYRRRHDEWQQHHDGTMREALTPAMASELAVKLSDAIGAPITFDTAEIFRDICVKARALTDLYADLFARVSPPVAIFFNESTLRERTAARVARQAGVKTVAIQHGLFIGNVYRSLATDMQIVWGRTPREFWLARGCAPERVVSVGALGHEQWPSAAGRAPKAAPTVLVLGQNPASDISRRAYHASIRAIADAVRQLPGVRMIVRPHPAEPATPYQDAFLSLPPGAADFTIESDRPLVDALLDADVVVTVFSTAGLEAMLLGTPVVVLNSSEELTQAPYASAAVVVQDGRSLAAAVTSILSDAPSRERLIDCGRKYAVDYFGPVDGLAARRAALAIETFARGNR